MKHVLSILIWICCALLTVAVFFAMLFFTIILFPFDKQRKIVHAQCFWWAEGILAINPFWKVHVSGLDNIDHNQTYVITANHQSLGDIVILYKTHMQFKWVARENVFKVPFIGWNLGLAKHIKIYRGQFGSIKQTYATAREWLQNGMSVLFFPEGTRSKTGKLNDFKNGAFKLAINEHKPVLPITISGTRDAIQKGSWVFARTVTCELNIHPAVDTAQFQMKDLSRLKEIVYSRLSEK